MANNPQKGQGLRFALALLAGTVAGSALLGACGDDDSGPGIDAIEFTVVTTDQLRYEPSELRVHAGQPVIVHVDNQDGSSTHDLSIETIKVGNVDVDEPEEVPGHMHMDHLDLHVMLGAAQQASITFTPTEPGTYEFFCTTTGHREAGMTGVLIVE
jgi:uncharacterized cupredoxin-like copper-binding protein